MATEQPDSSEAVLTIDKDRLDKEWLEQPQLRWKYSKRLAKRKAAVDSAKAHFDLVKAQVKKDIRENPRKYGFDPKERLTESAISDARDLAEEVIAAEAAYNEAKYEMDLGYAMVAAISDRKEALENLVKLHGQDYFATPRGEAGAVSMMKEGKRSRVDKRTARDN